MQAAFSLTAQMSFPVYVRQQRSQPHASFVQLRLGIPNRTSEKYSDFFVLVSVDIMKNEGCFVTVGQYIDGGLKVDPAEQVACLQVRDVECVIGIGVVLHAVAEEHPRSFIPAETHQDGVRRQAVQPRGKCRLPAKRVDLKKEQDEYVLSSVLGFRRISQHAQTDAVHELGIASVNECKGLAITLTGQPNRLTQGRTFRLL